MQASFDSSGRACVGAVQMSLHSQDFSKHILGQILISTSRACGTEMQRGSGSIVRLPPKGIEAVESDWPLFLLRAYITRPPSHTSAGFFHLQVWFGDVRPSGIQVDLTPVHFLKRYWTPVVLPFALHGTVMVKTSLQMQDGTLTWRVPTRTKPGFALGVLLGALLRFGRTTLQNMKPLETAICRDRHLQSTHVDVWKSIQLIPDGQFRIEDMRRRPTKPFKESTYWDLGSRANSRRCEQGTF